MLVPSVCGLRTTQQDPTHQKAGNLLDQEFEATAPNQKWLTDVTAVWTQEGCCTWLVSSISFPEPL